MGRQSQCVGRTAVLMAIGSHLVAVGQFERFPILGAKLLFEPACLLLTRQCKHFT